MMYFIKSWFCELFAFYCIPSKDFGIWSPLQRGICSITNPICGDTQSDVTQELFPDKPNRISNFNSCTYDDLIKFWTQTDVCEQSLPEMLLKDGGGTLKHLENEWFLCRNSWTEIPDFYNYWVEGFQKIWCRMADCTRANKVLPVYETGVVRTEKSRANWVREFLSKYFWIEFYVKRKPYCFGVAVCVFGFLLCLGWLNKQRLRKEKRTPQHHPQDNEDSELLVLLRHKPNSIHKHKDDTQESNYKITDLQSALENANALLEKTKNNEHKLQDTIQNYETKIHKLANEMGKLQTKIETQDQQLHKKDFQNTLLQEKEQKIKKIQRELQELESFVNNITTANEQQLKAHQEESKMVIQELQLLKEDNNKLRRQLLQTSGEKEELKLQARIQSDKLDEFRTLLDVRLNEKNNLQQQLRIQSGQLDAFQEQIRKTSEQVDRLDRKPEQQVCDKPDYVYKSLLEIEQIFTEVESLRKDIEVFSGTKTDKDYLHLNEMLIRATIRLDNVDSRGNNEIRMQRRKVIGLTQECLEELHNRLNK